MASGEDCWVGIWGYYSGLKYSRGNHAFKARFFFGLVRPPTDLRAEHACTQHTVDPSAGTEHP